MNVKFYRCPVCGQLAALVKSTGAPLVCCGKPMEEIIAGSVDASEEKHIPVYEVKGDTVEVCVGSVPHPMTEEHFIEWVFLKTKFGNQRKALRPGEEPKVCFKICDGDEVEAVYAYCNLHSLWRTKQITESTATCKENSNENSIERKRRNR